jgi:alpha-D-ribose 1-methylphosphonate 5-triphosphate synthase subunit PhnG
MRRSELNEVAAYAPIDQLKAITERCLAGTTVRVTLEPEAALIMTRVEDSLNGEIFNLGEVLVTRCAVVVGGREGQGIVLGSHPDRAMCAAVIDALDERALAADLDEALREAFVAVHEQRQERWRAVQSTRVEFEELPQ